MRVVWTEPAARDRRSIKAYIWRYNPHAADQLDAAFVGAARRLLMHPEIGKPGHVPGTRELFPHRRYRMVYKIDGEVIVVLALVHAARDWPPRPKARGGA